MTFAVFKDRQFRISRLDRGLLRNKTVQLAFRPVNREDEGKQTVWLGWGRKKSGDRARRIAASEDARFLLLEDGFLRSVNTGPTAAAVSLACDDLGIYYDARYASRLEQLIQKPLGVAQVVRAQDLILGWREGRVSKYNGLREYEGVLPEKYVLVVDQTFGDASVRCGLAGPESFGRMLEAALLSDPDATVLIKTHPDVKAGKKNGYLTDAVYLNNPRVEIISENVHPVRLIENAAAIFCVTSQVGFEGLLWGKDVHVFGAPFYAGWGLTTDHAEVPSRRRSGISLAQLVHAALVDYCLYVDPASGKPWEVEEALEFMKLQRRMRQRFPKKIVAYDFSNWKKPLVRSFLQGSEVVFTSSSKPQEGGGVVVWGSRSVPAGVSKGAAVVRLEDGFIRSVGLGADLISPISWVADSEAIYYDSTRVSGLEQILQHTEFDSAILSRARDLRLRILDRGLTKYNLDGGIWKAPVEAKTVILVPGQVESDASIAMGAPVETCSIRRNIDLLKAVRSANPGAYIIYKPHPDVLAGLRLAGVDEKAAVDWCDEQVFDVSMDSMLNSVDEVHVLTSLSGFEALLRGKPVVCYGQPFYSGWGLTKDIVASTRRNRILTLDELVAGVLLLYPTYVSRRTGAYISPETALDELEAWREEKNVLKQGARNALRWFLRRQAK